MGCYQIKTPKFKFSQQSKLKHSYSFKNKYKNQNTEDSLAVSTLPREKNTKKKLSVGTPKLEKVDQYSSTIPTDSPMSTEQTELLHKALSNIFLFTSFSPEQVLSLSQNFKLHKSKEREKICIEEQLCNSCFYIEKGSFEVWTDGSLATVLRQGDLFGILALISPYKSKISLNVAEDSLIRVLSGTDFTKICKEKEILKTQNILKALQASEIFQTLFIYQQEILLTKLILTKLNEGQQVNRIEETKLFIMLKGKVSVNLENNKKTVTSRGHYFMHMHWKKDRDSVKALTKSSMLEFELNPRDRKLFKSIFVFLKKGIAETALSKSSVFNELSSEKRVEIVDTMKFVRLNKEEKLKSVLKYDMDAVVFVISGQIRLQYKTLGIYSCLGDKEMCRGFEKCIFGEWKAERFTELGVLHRKDLEKSLGKSLFDAVSVNRVLQDFRKIEFLKMLPELVRRDIAENVSTRVFGKGKVIFKEGNLADEIYVLKEGRVKIFKDDKVVRYLSRCGYFGESCLIEKEFRVTKAVSKGAVCWVIPKNCLLPYISPEIKTILHQSAKYESLSITLQDLILIKSLGNGTFGTVHLCENRKSKELLALKSIEKSAISKFSLESNIQSEKKTMMHLDHPFIVHLHKTFQCSSRFYFLLELVEGIELFDLIHKFQSLSPSKSRFYSACLVLILEYLHERKIVFRDLKPENVMIDLEGFPKLIDFGFAKIVKGRTSTVLGTPHYMAPEVVTGKEYGASADYWSFGVMLFEFLLGGLPFGENSNNPVEINNEICNKELDFNVVKNREARELLERLLSRVPGNRGDCDSIKRSRWFEKIDFEMVIEKKVDVPYRPANRVAQEFVRGYKDYKESYKEFGVKNRIENLENCLDNF